MINNQANNQHIIEIGCKRTNKSQICNLLYRLDSQGVAAKNPKVSWLKLLKAKNKTEIKQKVWAKMRNIRAAQ